MEVLVINCQKRIKLNLVRLRKVAREALKRLGCLDKELSVALVDDGKMMELNRRYLGRDRPSDVLAFPMDSDDGPLLGDVVISVDRALAQAKQARKGLDEELIILLLHGVLHLLGYDHTGSRREASRMAAVQAKLASELASLLPLASGRP
ncbi:MAG: rRNA maturation RNase YbeY [Thermodesulfobacteriota bacterium]